MLVLEDEIPNFDLNTTKGKFKLHDFIGDSWCILYSHTLAFTPICTTDLAAVTKLWNEYTKRNLKAIALTCSPVQDNKEWEQDILHFAGASSTQGLPFPIISDDNRNIASGLGMLHQNNMDKSVFPLTVRKALIISPEKKLKAELWYPDEVGRNYNEIIRIVDALQITSKKKSKLGTPANWNRDEKCLILPLATKDEMTKLFPKGYDVVKVPSGREYLKITDCSQ